MTLLSQVLWLVICSGVFVIRLRADTIGHDNLGIIGGKVVTIKDVPFIVSLCDRFACCGGSIIHEWFILTAAHCVYGPNHKLNLRDLQVRMGSDRLESGGILKAVTARVCHPDYDYWHHEHDICLLKLKKPVEFGIGVSRVNLTDEYQQYNGPFNVTGWGITKAYNKYYSNKLHQTVIHRVGDNLCKAEYPQMTEDMFCAGSDLHSACEGDSGGPVTDEDVQIGVVSFGYGCGSKTMVNIKVSSYREWIDTTIAKHLKKID